ncbi:glycosyl hydrolase family 18 protein [Streptomyces gobiensis]|uniref:glycosyl hydrolase family 18 protein n=1 Tax=Streptomyces gobiensis TaxID=2875706 RepID=UPI001E4E26D6|nr:glycosyl hydrolase family 18 protein [Streptomyces gobiensis]UGY91102.1 hypothetical protein test1122_04765 [Streptomyces gobiensis]
MAGLEYVGYFPQWSMYDRKFFLKDLDTNGTAKKLTILNYAFANISSNNKRHPGYKCFAATAPYAKRDPEADGSIDVGDADADWLWPFKAEDSVDGVADPGWGDDKHLKGNFNQLKKLRAKHPHLKVLVSIGGWTYSRNFSEAAKTQKRREEFVKSFIDFYIRGNLPTEIWTDTKNYPAQFRKVYGGAGLAAGIFDGFDIDWEWPASNAGLPGNGFSPEDRKNLPLLLKEFRKQLDVLDLPQKPRGGKYLLTAFLPADPEVLKVGWDVPEIMKFLDHGNLQGYDLHGPFDCPSNCVTNHQSALHLIADDPSTKKLSVETAVKAWLDARAPRQKIVLGVPFYSRGWEGVQSSAKNGLFQKATGPVSKANGAKYEAGVNDYRSLAPLAQQGYTVHRDDANGVAWLFNPEKKIFWTFDDPMAAYQKAKYAKELGLAGAMAYSLDGDDKSTGILSQHIRAALNGEKPPTKQPPAKNACTAPEWKAEYIYSKPSIVTYAGKMWQGQYWTQKTPPGSKDSGGGTPWRELRTCQLPIHLEANGAQPWKSGVAYACGTMVTHNGELFTAAYDVKATQNIAPGTDPNTWQPHGRYEKAGI